MRDFGGKLALVTGAASGIGRETALALARAGADLVVCDVNEAALEGTAGAIRGLGRAVLARKVDVAHREEMEAFAAAVHREHAAVDVLVNNAGVALGGGFLDTTLFRSDLAIEAIRRLEVEAVAPARDLHELRPGDVPREDVGVGGRDEQVRVAREIGRAHV